MPGGDARGPETPGRYAYEGLDRALHEKARLGILTSLMAHRDGLSFRELKELCALTDGNLNRHLKILADAGLVDQERQRGDGRPKTVCQLTDEGRERFLAYLAELERVLRDGLAPDGRPRTAPHPG